MTYGWFAEDFKKSWESHFITKATIQNKLIIKKYPRDELIRRVNLQYSYRSFHIHTRLNEKDAVIIEFLSELAINSIYEIVRKEARENLYTLLSQYPYSTLKLVPKLKNYLDRNSNEKTKLNKEQIDGCLRLIHGSSQQASFLLKQSWHVMGQIWPSLFRCRFFEKDNTSHILDLIYEKVNETYESFDNTVKINPKAIIDAYLICPSLASMYNDIDDEKRLLAFNKNLENDKKYIGQIIQSLVFLSTDPKVLLKNQRLSFFSLIYLLNPCQIYPELLTSECVKLFVDSLVHDNIDFRQISIDGLCIILKMIKHEKETRTLKTIDVIKSETNQLITEEKLLAVNKAKPGYRYDNKWNLYDPNFLNDCFVTKGLKAEEDNKKWENAHFLDKSYWGYYCWPAQITINSNKRKMFRKNEETTNKYKHVIKPILKRFHRDAEFVKKFIKYSTIEESKGNEAFDKKRFHLFKALFRNFGSTDIFNGLFDHLKILVSDRDAATCESNHKLAAELIAGLIRGSKYWSLNDLKEMWSELKLIMDLAIKNITTETLVIWLECFSTSFEDQDPRRMVFYINYFRDLFIKVLNGLKSNSQDTKKSSFEYTNSLQIISAFAQFEWRIPSFWSSLLVPLQENMSSTNKMVREILPSCLSLVTKFHHESIVKLTGVVYIHWQPLLGSELIEKSNLHKFIDYLETRLTEAIELFDIIGDKSNDEKVKELQRGRINEFISNLNFVQTMVNWLYAHIFSSLQSFNSHTLKLIEKLSKIDKVASYEDTIRIKLLSVRAFLPILSLDETCINNVIDIVKQTCKSPSWRTRLSSAQIIQNFGVFNISLITTILRSDIKKVIIDLLYDQELKVRLSACVALTSLIHSNFIQVDTSLIDYFKNLTKSKARKKEENTEKLITDTPNLVKRHGGILGLCSIVNASPYDVPSYLPDVVTHICHFINDPVPIQESAKKCISEFKRTHQDNWQENKLKFTQDQLSMLSETSVSQNYYA